MSKIYLECSEDNEAYEMILLITKSFSQAIYDKHGKTD